MSNERYTRNRNLWKKAYPLVGQKPRVQEFVAGEITYSINLGNIQRDRNLYRIYPDYGQFPIPVIPPEGPHNWEDGKYLLVDGNPDTEYTITFNEPFVNPPIVCFGIIANIATNPDMILPDSNDISPSGGGYSSPTVHVYGVNSPTQTSATFRLSANYTGTIHYFAFDSLVAATVTPNPLYWNSGIYQASGGSATASFVWPDCSQNFVWDPITNASSTDDVFVTVTPYLIEPTASTPVVLLNNNFSPDENYNPFYSGPDTYGSDVISGSTSGLMILHYIAISKNGGPTPPSEGFMYTFEFSLGN